MAKKEDNCKSVWNILKVQYAPRDLILRKNLQSKALKKYKKMNYCKKIGMIDKLQSGGYFD
jgi:hypothetical protein